jgi:hypothetical protein
MLWAPTHSKDCGRGQARDEGEARGTREKVKEKKEKGKRKREKGKGKR